MAKVPAQMIIGRALLGIAQYLVRLLDLLEFVLGVLFLADVRVILARQLAIGALHLIGIGAAGQPENFVIILILHAHLSDYFYILQTHSYIRPPGGRMRARPAAQSEFRLEIEQERPDHHGMPRYHIAVVFAKKRPHEAHFPLYRHEPGRLGPSHRGAVHRRERLRRAFGAGRNLGGLLVFAAIFGFGGSLISLALSKWTAKRMMGVRVITAPQSELERWLVGTVKRLAEQARIGMPEVGIFDSEEMNAFATGARRNAALGGREQRPAAQHVAHAGRGGTGSRNYPCRER